MRTIIMQHPKERPAHGVNLIASSCITNTRHSSVSSVPYVSVKFYDVIFFFDNGEPFELIQALR